MHTYPWYRAGYWSNEPINVSLPFTMFSAICPRCLKTVPGTPSGLVVRTEWEGDREVGRILDNHSCVEVVQ